MRPALPFRTLLVIGLLGPSIHAQPPAADGPGGPPQPFFRAYCQGCHAGEEAEADLRLDLLIEPVDLLADHQQWTRVAEVVRLGEMPPGDELQPSGQERQQFLGWLEPALKTLDARLTRQPGRVTIRRLNRAEYNNTVRDLLGIDFQPADDFPADDVGNGFDNIADVLSLPPLLMEKYLDAAEQIVRRVLADAELRNRLIHRWPSQPPQREACAREVLERFATRAYRRPLQPEEVDRLMGLVQEATAGGADYVQSLELALQAVLASPHFLFRIELDEAAEGSDGPRALNGYELASRLSYFLWSSMPDEPLFELAAAGQLADPAVRHAQVQRMLADPKSRALVDNFAAQWLELRNLAKLTPDLERFPDFDESLRRGDAAGNRIVLSPDHGGRSQRAGLPGRRLHVSQ